VIAALTILRAFHVAGRPVQMGPDGKPVTPLGSFEEWSNFIRGALIWLGVADPCDTMEKIRKKDPKLGAMVTVISQWLEVIGYKERVTAKDLIECAIKKVDDGSSGYYPKQEFAHPEFRDALLIVAGDGGAINSLKLGKWLGANQDRFVLGYKIVQDGERGGSKLWKLESKEAKPAPAQTNF
jgi:putative DNA primase/helicase